MLTVFCVLGLTAVVMAGWLWPPPVADQAPGEPEVAAPQETAASPVDPPAPDLQSLAAAWQQPLFSPERKPDIQPGPARKRRDASTLTLTGVIVEGPRRVALFKQKAGADLALKEGATLGEGWRISRIEPRSVELRDDSGVQVLYLMTPRLTDTPSLKERVKP